jgi:hypothetical protein
VNSKALRMLLNDILRSFEVFGMVVLYDRCVDEVGSVFAYLAVCIC